MKRDFSEHSRIRYVLDNPSFIDRAIKEIKRHPLKAQFAMEMLQDGRIADQYNNGWSDVFIAINRLNGFDDLNDLSDVNFETLKPIKGNVAPPVEANTIP